MCLVVGLMGGPAAAISPPPIMDGEPLTAKLQTARRVTWLSHQPALGASRSNRHRAAGMAFGTIAVAPQNRGRWQGQGRIVEGQGLGGIVQLTLHFNGNRVWTTQGPPLDQSTQRLHGVTLRAANTAWTFLRCGERLCVSLKQQSPHRVIRYLLERS